MILFTMNWFSLFNSSTVPYFPFLLPPLTPSQTFYALVIIVTSAKMDNHPVSHPCGFCCSIFNSREEKARHNLTHFVPCILCRLILPTKGLLLKHLHLVHKKTNIRLLDLHQYPESWCWQPTCSWDEYQVISFERRWLFYHLCHSIFWCWHQYPIYN